MIRRLRADHPLELAEQGGIASGHGLIRRVAACLAEDAIITTDVGQHQMKVAQVYPFKQPRTWQTSGGLGTMGFGFPAAIGAALAAPGKRVVCFTGDGSFLMNIQELATLVEEQLDVKIIVMDNRSLGLVHQQQDLFYGSRFIGVHYSQATDFAGIANCFGIPSTRLTDAADGESALAAALMLPGPHLIHAPVDVMDKVFPMVPPGGANADMITSTATRSSLS